MRNNWQAKKLKIYVPLIILCIVSVVGVFGFSKFSTQLNLLTLTITLVVLIWYAYDTHRIANQTVESNLRPVVLRSGYIHDWKSISFEQQKDKIIKGKTLQFTILKNIAKDIRGHIIINKYKYKLLFGNEISKGEDGGSWLAESWGWMKPDTSIYAAFIDNDREKTTGKNEIYIEYRDIEGNRYSTVEDEKFSQKSFKL